MGVYVRKDSKFYWLYLERPGGRGLKERVAVPVDAPTAEQRKSNRQLAESLYVQRMAQLARGDHGLTQPKPAITFRKYALWYREHVTSGKRTAARERSAVDHWIDAFDLLPLAAVDRDRVLEARSARLLAVEASTVNREVDVLKHMLATAVPKYLTSHPIAGLRRLRVVGRGIRLLSRDEETRLLAAATDPATRALILLGLDALLRLNDARTLRHEHDHGTRLQVINPKGPPYWVHVSRRLRAALDALPRRSPFVFPKRWPGRTPAPIAASTVDRLFRLACTSARLPVGRAATGLTFHALRHTGTTRALDAGINPRVVQEMGGWTSLRQLQRYGHSSDRERRRATAAIAGEPFPEGERSAGST